MIWSLCQIHLWPNHPLKLAGSRKYYFTCLSVQEISETTFLPVPNMQAEMSSGASLRVHPDSHFQIFLLVFSCTHTENYAICIHILNHRLSIVVYCCTKIFQICKFFSCRRHISVKKWVTWVFWNCTKN